MSDTVTQIKERLSIVDVVQPYVKLTRAGKYWKGISPFTKEKTPSFFVTPDKGLYHCFSTGKGGDMFTFVEEMEGVDFKGALQILAEKAGVEIVREAPGAKDEREKVYMALDAARAFYHLVLKDRKDVQEYLANRGITPDMIERWHIGYASKAWHDLRDELLKKGFTEPTLLSAGLIKKPDSADTATSDKPDVRRPYDRFRGRIMFPIADASGRVIAFSGRIFEDDPKNPQAKYLNSPEGPVFDKSRALYGIHEAKNGIRELGAALLVEGQVDLLMAHKIGYKNAVATSGTAFSANHVDILKRYSPNMLLAYDGDKAGITAAGRAAALALPRGMNVKVVRMPPGVDPADQIHTDPTAFKEAVKKSVHIVDFYLEHLRETLTDKRAYRLEVGRVVLPYIALIDNKLDQAHFVERVAEALAVSADDVRAELKKIAVERVTGAKKQDAFLSPIVYRDQFLFGIYRTLKDEHNDEWAERVHRVLVGEFGPDAVLRFEESSPEELERAKILASENFFVLYPDDESRERVIAEIEREGSNRSHTSEKDRLQREIKLAASAGDFVTEAALMEELSKLAKGDKN